jgi:hypothetical protein
MVQTKKNIKRFYKSNKKSIKKNHKKSFSKKGGYSYISKNSNNKCLKNVNCNKPGEKNKTNFSIHQTRIVKYKRWEKNPSQKGILVFHEMGTGKTYTGVAFLYMFPNTEKIIICPESIWVTWKKHLEFLNCEIPNTYYTSYNCIKSFLSQEPKNLQITLSQIFAGKVIVFDEAHHLIGILNDKMISSTNKTIFYNAIHKSKKHLLLTGTPFYFDQHDIVYLVNLCHSNANPPLLPFNRTEFRKEYYKTSMIKSFFYGWLIPILNLPIIKYSFTFLHSGMLISLVNKFLNAYNNRLTNTNGFAPILKQNEASYLNGLAGVFGLSALAGGTGMLVAGAIPIVATIAFCGMLSYFSKYNLDKIESIDINKFSNKIMDYVDYHNRNLGTSVDEDFDIEHEKDCFSDKDKIICNTEKISQKKKVKFTSKISKWMESLFSQKEKYNPFPKVINHKVINIEYTKGQTRFFLDLTIGLLSVKETNEITENEKEIEYHPEKEDFIGIFGGIESGEKDRYTSNGRAIGNLTKSKKKEGNKNSFSTMITSEEKSGGYSVNSSGNNIALCDNCDCSICSNYKTISEGHSFSSKFVYMLFDNILNINPIGSFPENIPLEPYPVAIYSSFLKAGTELFKEFVDHVKDIAIKHNGSTSWYYYSKKHGKQIYFNQQIIEKIKMIKIEKLPENPATSDTLERYTKFAWWHMHKSDDKAFDGFNFDNLDNSEDNIKSTYKGELGKDQKINILLLHPKHTEGISLDFTKQLHIMEPLDNPSLFEQIKARVVRFCDTKYTCYPRKFSVDIFLYKCTVSSWANHLSDKIKHWGDGKKSRIFWKRYQGFNQDITPDTITYKKMKNLASTIKEFQEKFPKIAKKMNSISREKKRV